MTTAIIDYLLLIIMIIYVYLCYLLSVDNFYIHMFL